MPFIKGHIYPNTGKTHFNKGRKPWNTGKKGLCLNTGKTHFKKGHIPWNQGKPYLQITGKKHWLWKGNQVSYRNLHRWIERHLGKPNTCQFCHRTLKRLHWANKSRKYLRKLSDWIRLCPTCHKKFDKEQGASSN